MKKIAFLSCIAFALAFAGCASIVNGSTQIITVSSNVEGADIVLVDLEKNTEVSIGKTPFTGPIQRLKNGKLIVKKDGSKPVEVVLTSEVNPLIVGNILCGGTLGTSTDYGTGALWRYSPASYMANLAPGKAGLTERFQKESKMRHFALLNYDRISDDLASGKGQYLDSICDLYGANTSESKREVVSFVAETHKSSVSIPEFANRMAARM